MVRVLEKIVGSHKCPARIVLGHLARAPSVNAAFVSKQRLKTVRCKCFESNTGEAVLKKYHHLRERSYLIFLFLIRRCITKEFVFMYQFMLF